MVTTITDNESKALNAVPGKIHGGLTEDEDSDYNDHEIEMRGHICLNTLCLCVHNFYHIEGV